jgi:hypothetical protein
MSFFGNHLSEAQLRGSSGKEGKDGHWSRVEYCWTKKAAKQDKAF